MKVIAVNGSARKDGNTAVLLRTVLEELQKAGAQTQLVQLAESGVRPCRACWACGGRGNCVHNDDAFCEIFEQMKTADAILLGSPVYSANVSAGMQALLERAAVVCDMNPGLLAHKVGASVAAARRGGALHALDAMNHFFLNHEMVVAGATYWNLAYGQMPEDVKKDTEGMQTMQSLGQNMAWLLHALAQNREEL